MQLQVQIRLLLVIIVLLCIQDVTSFTTHDAFSGNPYFFLNNFCTSLYLIHSLILGRNKRCCHQFLHNFGGRNIEFSTHTFDVFLIDQQSICNLHCLLTLCSCQRDKLEEFQAQNCECVKTHVLELKNCLLQTPIFIKMRSEQYQQ